MKDNSIKHILNKINKFFFKLFLSINNLGYCLFVGFLEQLILCLFIEICG